MKNNLTPCIGICKLDKKKEFCIGCSRTIYDIKNWKNYSLSKKRGIMESLKK